MTALMFWTNILLKIKATSEVYKRYTLPVSRTAWETIFTSLNIYFFFYFNRTDPIHRRVVISVFYSQPFTAVGSFVNRNVRFPEFRCTF